MLTQIIVGKALEYFSNKIESKRIHTMPLNTYYIIYSSYNGMCRFKLIVLISLFSCEVGRPPLILFKATAPVPEPQPQAMIRLDVNILFLFSLLLSLK